MTLKCYCGICEYRRQTSQPEVIDHGDVLHAAAPAETKRKPVWQVRFAALYDAAFRTAFYVCVVFIFAVSVELVSRFWGAWIKVAALLAAIFVVGYLEYREQERKSS